MQRHSFEIPARSLLKTLSWKLIALIISFSVSYSTTGDFYASLRIGLTVTVVGLVAYYLHERLWNRVHWGKKHNSH